ncbi:MAG: 16S rRNA (uracil(1498)-N(3))-methyltransferase [Deltaproteobacteria bacterium]|nr:16S rRNA (uracil(1498)-N(3))-methyltransferase [Deltaproteobacteria bacterium]
MRRFLIDPALPISDQAALTGSQARHALRVLRLKPGDQVCLIDGQGHEWETRIVSTASDRVELDVIEQKASLKESPLELTLGLAVLKAAPMDLVIQKGTELGLKRLIPLYSARSAVRMNQSQAEKRRARWQKIALEALKQCQRGWPVEIHALASLEVFLSAASQADLRLMLYEEKRSALGARFKELLRQSPEPRSVFVLVGPEGGFTSEEVSRAEEAGFEILGLGPRVMRSETAALALMAILGFAWGDL